MIIEFYRKVNEIIKIFGEEIEFFDSKNVKKALKTALCGSFDEDIAKKFV